MRRIPRKFIFISIYLIGFFIFLFIIIITIIKVNKVYPFKSNILEAKENGYIYASYKKNNFYNLNINIEATNFDVSNKYTATFKITMSNKDLEITSQSISMGISVSCDYIKLNAQSAITQTLYTNGGTKILTVSNLVQFPNKFLFFKIKYPKIYLYLEYEAKDKKGNINNYASLIEYKYNEIKVTGGGIPS